MPATGAAAAKRSAYWHAIADVRNAPLENPVTYTRLRSMQRFAPASSRTSPMKVRSSEPTVVFQCAGVPWPWGAITAKPSSLPSAPRFETPWWKTAPSA